MPISFKGRVVQYAGRLHRKYNGKMDIKIYDYVDADIPVLWRMYEKRLKTYKVMGYQIDDITKIKKEDVEYIISSISERGEASR